MKLSYLVPAVAVVLLTGCASEDVVNPQAPNSEKDFYAMSFTSHNKNMSRADLQDVHNDFGVWAYKGDTEADKVGGTNAVMLHYLVGYTGGAAYTAPTATVAQESDWYYENFGNTQGLTTNSNVPSQFLKYWDLSKAHTFFYAYAPYVKGAEAPTFTVGDHSDATHMSKLQFNQYVNFGVASDPSNNLMYAAKAVAKADYGTEVALEFKRFNAKLRLAYYNAIPGYNVEILDMYNADGSIAAADNDTDNQGVVAWAATRTENGTTKDVYGTDVPKYDYSTTGVKYVKRAKPVVTFSDAATNGTITGTVDFADITAADKSNAVLAWKAPTETAIGTDLGHASYSPTEYNVVPVGDIDDTLAAGFRFFITYKLTSTDGSGEEITVYNAPVYVPALYTKWSSNTIYTYVFKIGRNSAGSTEKPEDPDPVNPDDPALMPIVFDNLIVANFENTEKVDVFEITTGSHEEKNKTDIPAFPF